jgi:hypothetical protein
MWKPLFVKIMYYFLKHVVLGIFYALHLFSCVTVNLAVKFAVYVSMSGKSFYYPWDWLEAFPVGKFCSKFAYWLWANLVHKVAFSIDCTFGKDVKVSLIVVLVSYLVFGYVHLF